MKIRITKLPSNTKALGGVLQAHGSDWSDGLVTIGAGGTHEESPYDGVQMGVDQNGTPNLVEEGEVVYDDYVYSNRIPCDLTTKKKFHISKNRDITYAELAKKLEKEISERPNDAVSKAGFEKQMEALADEQERQKAEMEAERAKAAFEALSPEEQTALMQQRAEQEAMAQQQAIAEQQAAMQQPSQEEMLMAQQQEAAQQQAMMDGSQAMAEQPQVMAEGGHLFPWGGYENLFSVKPPYAPSNSAGFIPYDRALTPEEVMKLEQEQRFIDWTNYVNEHWDEDYVQNYLKALDSAAGGNHLFDKEGKILNTAKDYFNNARTKNHLWGYYHLTPEQIAEEAASQKPSGRVYHAVVGDDDYLEGDPSTWRGVGAEARREVLPNGDTVIYHDRLPADDVVQRPGEAGKSPVGDVDMSASARAKGDGEGSSGTGTGSVKFERSPLSWLRYAPALGGAIGLFNNILNKPDYSRAQAVIDYARDTEANGARVMPRFIGDYLRYNPLDIWYAQNNMNAQSRATDRALMNNTAPTRMAGLLANGYNSQIASGNLFRQAQEYNDNLRHQVADFNRRTNMFNAEADMNAQRTNASLRQDNRRMGLQGLMTGYKMMDDLDDRRSASMSANLTNLVQSLGNIGEEEYDMDRLKWLEKTGVLRSKVYSAKGGNLKRKKGKRGLTY